MNGWQFGLALAGASFIFFIVMEFIRVAEVAIRLDYQLESDRAARDESQEVEPAEKTNQGEK